MGSILAQLQQPKNDHIGVLFIAGSLESQLIGLFSGRQFFRDWWRGAFSQYIFRNVLMFLGVVLSNVAGKVIICDKNVSASGGGRFQKLSSISSKNCRAYQAGT